MSSILERLREALAPEYRVEHEIARGGMGIVFLARDVALDRPVAVKIIRPELATARAAHRFLREARILATVQHPNVVPIFKAGEANGFIYYVMEYVEGETLTERLKRGLPSHEEVLKLGRDVLDALDAVHAKGVIHRDLKPSNIFLCGGRAVISDFGIAKPSVEPTMADTTDGRVVGTFGYMSPEQAFGRPVTEATDLYATGVVLYEAYTGRSWASEIGETRPNWSGVPRSVVPALRRALAFKAADRWPDAQSFRRVLWRTRSLRYRRKAVYYTLFFSFLGVAVGGLLVGLYVRGARGGPITDVAILPFESGPGVEPALADNLTELTQYHVQSFADVLAQWRVADRHDVAAWWREVSPAVDSIGGREARALRTRYLAHAAVAIEDSDTAVTIKVFDSRGRAVLAPVDERLGHGRSLASVGRRLGSLIVSAIEPNRLDQYTGSPALVDRTDAALNAYLDGIRAFKRNGFKTATEMFTLAREEDPDFPLAEWWLSNAYRWRGLGTAHPDINLSQLLDIQRVRLPELERMLIEAQLATSQHERYEKYRAALDRFRRNGYAHFLYAEEMQSKGPHIGIPVEEATRQLELAASKDPRFGPAHMTLVWSYVRMGRREEAESSFVHYQQVETRPDEVDYPFTELMGMVIAERFYPERVPMVRASLWSDPAMTETLQRLFRRAANYDLARTQAELGEMFLDSFPDAPPDYRGRFHKGRALGLVALGRIEEALEHFDSAATLFDSPRAKVDAANWRVLGPAMGLPGFSESQRALGRTALKGLASDPIVGARATWALGVDAIATGAPSGHAWLDTLRASGSDTTAQRLADLLVSLQAGEAGGFRRALNLSEFLLPFDSAARGGDPFARAVLHMRRAEWYDSIGKPESADSARLWYEHFEWLDNQADSFPDEAQAAEIEWAISPYARLLRGWSAANRGNHAVACHYLARVLELWERADPAYSQMKDTARAYVDRRCL